ncbi:MAG: hypothetical protein LBS96_04185, partial [Oscillospiraceae bacterium]|nr:hypothetical protein [Oscillospiraceae bacterium]
AVRFGTPELHPLSEWEKPTKAWFYDEDGWVYYGDILKPGEMTPLLLANFYVLPDSPLAGGEENRYRLLVRPQSVALDLKGGFEANRAFVLAVWNTQAELFGLGTNQISQTAANFSLAMLKAAKLK